LFLLRRHGWRVAHAADSLRRQAQRVPA
jgi:hypothetical protein